MADTIFSSDGLTLDKDGHVAWLWLDRPDKLNALHPPMWADIPKALELTADDDDIRVVVVSGRGRAFTAGIDLAEFAPLFGHGDGGSDAERNQRLYKEIRRLQRTMTSFAECPKPVIAAVHGYCLGAGIDLVTACDIRLASSDAVFSIRETKVGMVADVGTLQRLPRIVSPGVVAELAFTGRDIGASEAERIGLVNHVYPDQATLLKAAVDLATEIAANSPLVVQGIKAVLTAETDMDLASALDHVALWNAAFLRSNDLQEAVSAFFERRPPRFTGT